MGSDAVSAVLIVTIFMLCLGIGSELSRRLLKRSNVRAIGVYAGIEIFVGIYGAFSIDILRAGNEIFSEFLMGSIFSDFFFNLSLLSPAVVGMGMTTPLIVHIAKEELRNIGRTIGIFYGLNIFGAAIGAFVTGLVLIESIGLTGSTYLAALFNILIGIVALALVNAEIAYSGRGSAGSGDADTGFDWSVGVAAVLFGFGTLAIQVIFFRVLASYFTLSTIVFPLVLCAYLILMALGQWIGGRLADRYPNDLVSVIAGLFATGTLLFLAALRFPPSWAAALKVLRFTTFNGQLISGSFPDLIGDPSPGITFIFSSVFMLSVIAWSALFPVMVRMITRQIQEAGERFAAMYSFYTVGNVIGTFACGLILLPAVGTGVASIITSLIVGLGCCVLLIRRTSGPNRTQAARYFLIIGAAACALFPHDYYKAFRLGGYAVADVFEGETGVATVVQTSQFYTIIDMSRTASASAIVRNPERGSSYEAWRWNHTELMAIDTDFRPKHVLIIGLGHAYLVDALLDLPFIEKIVIVEISKEILAAVKKYSVTATKRIFDDPRVEIVIGDGRRYVQTAAKSGAKFDLIQTKINEPWHAGSGNLFTVEFFEAQRRLLKPGGYLGVRPLNGHLSDGLSVFDVAVWPGFYHLFFKNGPLKLPPSATITDDIFDAWFREVPGHKRSTDREAFLHVFYFTNVPEALKTDPNTDDRPTFEYYWLRRTLGTWKSPRLDLFGAKQYEHKIPVCYDGSLIHKKRAESKKSTQRICRRNTHF